MPASSLDLYFAQDARNNFIAMRPAPVCPDANQLVGQCQQQIHVSTNRYYGFHDPKVTACMQENDCEMMETPASNEAALPHSHSNGRKRRASDEECHQTKRIRQEVQRDKSNEPETIEKRVEKNSEELLESLLWNIHGGNMFHFIQCL